MRLPRIVLYALGLFLWLGSCSPYFHQPLQPAPARVGEETAVTPLLRDLPGPSEPIYVAVYKFRDQTGQYKPSETGVSWSTAVTQGATSILLKALENSGWFVPVERENVSNLLNERKIIRNSNMYYSAAEEEQATALPPLYFAPVILEGGIISYDANILTGGVGARYFGTGGSAKYRQDRVTVYLRVISTMNGEILKTVYTSRTILSQAVDVGVFRYVSFQRLLEAETGFTFNEPAELAVTEAIEKAVQVLILEGLEDGLWQADPYQNHRVERALAAFRSERDQMKSTSYWGREYQPMTSGGAFTAGFSALHFRGDMPGTDWSWAADAGMSWQIHPWLSTGLSVRYGTIVPQMDQSINWMGFDWQARVRFVPHDRFSPIAIGGFGLLHANSSAEYTPPEANYWTAMFGLGAEYRLSRQLSLEVSGAYTYLLSDQLDALMLGRHNDMYWQGRIGLRYYLAVPNQ